MATVSPSDGRLYESIRASCRATNSNVVTFRHLNSLLSLAAWILKTGIQDHFLKQETLRQGKTISSKIFHRCFSSGSCYALSKFFFGHLGRVDRKLSQPPRRKRKGLQAESLQTRTVLKLP